MRYVGVALLLVLSGCVSPEQAAWERDQYEMNECMRLGFQPGTVEFANCRLQMRSIAAQQDAADASRDAASAIQSSTMERDIPRPTRCKKTDGGWTICK
jgi:hypothetical protein